MLGEFLARLAVALPLVCGLAVLSLWLLRRGRLRLPGRGLSGLGLTAGARDREALLDVLEVRAISPVARLAVIRFDGRTHLVGVAGQSISLLAPAGAAQDSPAEEER